MLKRAALRGFLVGLAAAGAFVAIMKNDSRLDTFVGSVVAGFAAGACLAVCSLVELAFAERQRSLGRAVLAAVSVLGLAFVGAWAGIFEVAYAVGALEAGRDGALEAMGELAHEVRRDPAFWCGLALAAAAPLATGTFIRLERGKGSLARALVSSMTNAVAAMVVAAPGLALMSKAVPVVASCCLAFAVLSSLLIDAADAVSTRRWPE